MKIKKKQKIYKGNRLRKIKPNRKKIIIKYYRKNYPYGHKSKPRLILIKTGIKFGKLKQGNGKIFINKS